ncbi:surface protein [Mycoplasmopsis canis UFG4]|uniref:Surface protein n=1 Tax=Mycoplasmopsis canis UFG4 TaxID=1131455 RepID=I1A5K1_9BACT|nr:leucine-rich repeat protein [Mycoplasmopsis canis]EIE41772.1 surface protein [Mycoplasmopsis canis UFG4]
MKKKLAGFLILSASLLSVTSCNIQNNEVVKNDKNKTNTDDSSKNNQPVLKSETDKENTSKRQENINPTKVSTSPSKTSDNKKQNKTIPTEVINNKKDDKKPTNIAKKEEKKKEIESKNNPQENYLELKDSVSSFIDKNLKELKYKEYKDQLENIINETYYNVVTKQYIKIDEYYSKQKTELEKIFNEVKTNYEKAANVSYTKEDLLVSEGSKNSNTSPNDYGQRVNENIQINEEAKYFMSLFSVDSINDYYKYDYQKAHKDFIAEKTQEILNNAKDKANTRIEKIRVIYDWIHSNLKYAHNGNVQAAIDPKMAFEKKFAVCGGYSNLYKAMLDSINVKNVVVIGWSEYGDHQWNLVYDDETNSFFHSDPTWGGNVNFKGSGEGFSRWHRAYQVIDAHKAIEGFEYEYNRGFSAFRNIDTDKKDLLKPLESIDEAHKVVSISQNVLDTTERLYIGENIERIDYSGGTHKVKWFEVSPKNQHFASKDGVLYTKDMQTLLVVPKKYENNEITLPKTVKIIEDWKGSIDVDNLTKINVEPGNYWYQSYGGILYSNNFSNIISIPKKIHNIITFHPNVKFKMHDVSFNKNIKEIIIPDGVENLPADFLNNLTSLKKIFLPSSLKTLEEHAFSNVQNNKFEIYLSDKMDESVIKILEKLKYKVKK